jgi:nucleotide-binding universal stress UspA family protein
MTTILLAADGSDFTRLAARYLATHLGWFAAAPEIHVLHVQPPLPYPRAAAVVGHEAVLQYQREASQAALEVAESPLREAGIAFRSNWRVGEVAEQIAEYVRENRIDFVVLGSHGHGAIASLALGSVAMRCVATLKVPVLIVPRGA